MDERVEKGGKKVGQPGPFVTDRSNEDCDPKKMAGIIPGYNRRDV